MIMRQGGSREDNARKGAFIIFMVSGWTKFMKDCGRVSHRGRLAVAGAPPPPSPTDYIFAAFSR